MRKLNLISIVSLVIGTTSLLTAIVAGFAGSLAGSFVAVGVLLITWVVWVTLLLIRHENRLILENACAETPARISPPFTMANKPKYHFLNQEPLLIDDPKRKIKIPGDFLAWDRFTLLFWVEVNDQFCDSANNRYLFAHTTDPASKDPSSDNYPNAFYLGIIGNSMSWRLVVKGPEPQNNTTINLATSPTLMGWKLFAVRWDRECRQLDFSIDAGAAFGDRRVLDKKDIPTSPPGTLFHLGGWLDTWHGGLSLLRFFEFKVFDRRLTDNEIRELYRHERERLL